MPVTPAQAGVHDFYPSPAKVKVPDLATPVTKTAIVTGASTGIGRAIALALAKAGYAIAVNYQSRAAEAEAVVATIVGADGTAFACRADVSTDAGAASLVTETLQNFGRLDVVVNNAGLAVGAPLAEIDEAHIHSLTAVNIAGVLLVSKHAAAAFPAPPVGGVIINISSINGITPIPGGAVYSATKAAVNAITLSLAAELGSRSIRVNAIAPGLTMTERYAAEIPDDAKAHVIAGTPLGRLGVPEDVAEVAVFLASDAARWITGQIVAVSGGAR
jgi:3-oxoacyl-[acyl-carrier protein] reductase